MSDQPTQLNKGDFERLDWQAAITASSEHTCWHYRILFRQQAETLHSSGDAIGESLFLRLALWTAPRLSDDGFAPYPEAVLAAFSENDFALLGELAPTANDAELRARLADLGWQGRVNNRRDPDMARLAVSSYLEASDAFLDKWWEQTLRIERALQVALSLGRKSDESESVWSHIENLLASINGDDAWFASARLMELMQEHSRGDRGIYIPMAERAALKAESQRGIGQWAKARRYWEVKANWHDKGSEEWFESLRRAAETHVAEAQDEIDGFYGRQEFIAAALHLQQAIEAYRNIMPHDRFQARIDELHRQMIQVNKEAQKTFESHTYTIDISDYAQRAGDMVKGKTFIESARELVLMYCPPALDTLRDQVASGNSELSELLCAHETVNPAGQVIARRPSLLSPDPQEREKATKAEMFNIARHHHGLFVQAMLIPALNQMQKEHQVFTRDWVQLIHHSPFVPTDREWLFARGFQAGWDNDWDVATHLLVPQVENSIRHILSRSGVLASALLSTGIQSEQGIDQTIIKPELTNLLPENLIFDLRGLLTEKTGDYLRHKTCHGLASFAEFYSVPSLYLWWLSLHLCLLPLLSLPPEDEQATPPSDIPSAGPEVT